ncbi:MAG: pyruvate kinase [Succinivibrionaceae bacterium]|nr:pyruvate kinase [Ruminobacter sp.]MDY5779025.1 pyruvate kinase [Succinivibrionaceae bacterium]MEE1339703.1 pyruvate kinase [Succinivibrionaceae bacterium]
MFRRTKIVCTMGPALDREGVLEQLIKSGANVMRINFSHGAEEDHAKRARAVREISKKLGVVVAIVGDLQGPKIRISTFKDGPILLKTGDLFTLDADLPKGEGTKESVGIDYKNLPEDVKTGDVLMLDDGRVQLSVVSVIGSKILTSVLVPGPLSNNKGINKQGGGLSAPALTEKDRKDIEIAARIGCDYVAVSFPRTGEDIELARKLLRQAGSDAKIIAKVERAEVVATDEAMEDVVKAADAVMVARGDLGVEIGDAQLMCVQKRLIKKSRQLNRPIITATQMMESMIKSPMPTRAEVMDVSNAVLDGSDAVMLSAETAAGDYPVETVCAMSQVCRGAEKDPQMNVSTYRTDKLFETSEETIAMSAMFAANHLPQIKGIVALTNTGRTPLLMSRLRSNLPIFALSPYERTLNWCNLFRGVYPVEFNAANFPSMEDAAIGALQALKAKGYVEHGDKLIVTHGDTRESGSTNGFKILVVN